MRQLLKLQEDVKKIWEMLEFMLHISLCDLDTSRQNLEKKGFPQETHLITESES